jgi:seryl-tRNA synthetase
VDIDRLLELDAQRRDLLTRQEAARAEQKRLAKETGPQIGQLTGSLKKAASDSERAEIEAKIESIKAAPARLKGEIARFDEQLSTIEPEVSALLLRVPLPPDDDVPVGSSSDDNVEIRRWSPSWWDAGKTFAANRGFLPRSHQELCESLELVDFQRGVRIAGSRSYVLRGAGMLLHQALTRYAMDFMVHVHGFTPMSVPVLVREEAMVGTGFFPAGRAQSYLIDETRRWQIEADEDEPGATTASGQDLYLTGTGEVGLMGLHMGEILDEADLPRKYVTVSTCFRREAGAAGKDTAGLYRVHQFDKVEQVVICRADAAESRAWHTKMIGFVEQLLQSLELPHRLLQCCTGDLGVKNADMVDLECWIPGRGATLADGSTAGAFGETHSASRLYAYQCRRLNMRYRAGGEGGAGTTTFCHSLNNTVAASPRLMIPLLEMHQNADGSVTIPAPLRPYMGGLERIG